MLVFLQRRSEIPTGIGTIWSNIIIAHQQPRKADPADSRDMQVDCLSGQHDLPFQPLSPRGAVAGPDKVTPVPQNGFRTASAKSQASDHQHQKLVMRSSDRSSGQQTLDCPFAAVPAF